MLIKFVQLFMIISQRQKRGKHNPIPKILSIFLILKTKIYLHIKNIIKINMESYLQIETDKI